MLEDYTRLIELTHLEIVSYPAELKIVRNRHLIRHAAGVPVRVPAMKSRPDAS